MCDFKYCKPGHEERNLVSDNQIISPFQPPFSRCQKHVIWQAWCIHFGLKMLTFWGSPIYVEKLLIQNEANNFSDVLGYLIFEKNYSENGPQTPQTPNLVFSCLFLVFLKESPHPPLTPPLSNSDVTSLQLLDTGHAERNLGKAQKVGTPL